MSMGTKGKKGNMSTLTPFKLDLTFQFKAGLAHGAIEASKTPITPRDLRKGYTQIRHVEAHLENQIVSQNVLSNALACHPSQMIEHGNKKVEITRSTKKKKNSSSKGTKALKCPNPELNFSFKPSSPVTSLDHGSHPFSFPPLPMVGWAIWHRNKALAIPDKMIAQIRAALMYTMGWFEEDLAAAWKHIFPITPSSVILGNLPLDHPA